MENKEILSDDMLSKFKKIIRINKQTNKTTLKSILGVGKQGEIDYLIESEPFDAYIESIDNEENSYKGYYEYGEKLKDEKCAVISVVGTMVGVAMFVIKLFKD